MDFYEKREPHLAGEKGGGNGACWELSSSLPIRGSSGRNESTTLRKDSLFFGRGSVPSLRVRDVCDSEEKRNRRRRGSITVEKRRRVPKKKLFSKHENEGKSKKTKPPKDG